jgi:hypothetical protein
MSAAGETSDLYLSAFEFSLAHAANALIIKRAPSPETIPCPQNGKSIVEGNVRDHIYKPLCSLNRIRQSGCWMIGKSDKTLRSFIHGHLQNSAGPFRLGLAEWEDQPSNRSLKMHRELAQLRY